MKTKIELKLHLCYDYVVIYTLVLLILERGDKLLTFQETIPLHPSSALEQLAKMEDLLFFDIETTGFQAEISSLYLIGCIYFENNCFHQIQWFADNYHSEEALLHAFFDLVKKHKTLVHFNGNRFDIPYLLKKCVQFHLPYHFEDCQSIDLYKQMKPYKKLFNLPNYKQKTLEEFLQMKRIDPFTGGELIKVYGDYIKAKVGYKDTNPLLKPLLLHNKEDLEGMLRLTDILYYIDVFEKPLAIEWFHLNGKSLEAIFILPHALPTPVSFQKDQYQLSLKDDRVFLSIQCNQGELKYFYPNYQDYCYLPEEDMAIHKSIAAFVDKEYRKKATKANCYLRKAGTFIPVYKPMDGFTIFKKEYSNPQLYIEINEELTSDSKLLADFLQQQMKELIST